MTSHIIRVRMVLSLVGGKVEVDAWRLFVDERDGYPFAQAYMNGSDFGVFCSNFLCQGEKTNILSSFKQTQNDEDHCNHIK